MSLAWFLGDNDTKVPLLDDRTGGGCDGLTPDGRNRNQGAESTIAMITRAAARPPPCRRQRNDGSPALSLPLVRTEHRLRPDASRTLCRLFVPGQETLIRGESRVMAVIDRVLALSDQDVETTLGRTLARFSGPHRDLARTLERNFELVAHRLGGSARTGHARRQLSGRTSPRSTRSRLRPCSIRRWCLHPDQSGCLPGEARFVMSLRAVGEGHLSSIEFRTGTIGAHGIRVDSPGRFPGPGHVTPVSYDRAIFQAKLADLVPADENARYLRDLLPTALHCCRTGVGARRSSTRSDDPRRLGRPGRRARWLAASSYAVAFDEDTALSERVLWPAGPAESHGMEDARFVRFADGDEATYYATYTAFDGAQVAPQLLQTADFRTFTVSPLSGPAARNKGMAIFPRRIAGRYAALSRWDRESNMIAYSADGYRWSEATSLQAPARPWELIQVGNCGSPIETPAGWLVFTHGVGPMREYAIGAVLLDLEAPERLIAALPEPLLVADESERSGYVPNVVYSCGAMLHGSHVVLPYGCSDSSVRIATMDLSLLLDRLARA